MFFAAFKRGGTGLVHGEVILLLFPRGNDRLSGCVQGCGSLIRRHVRIFRSLKLPGYPLHGVCAFASSSALVLSEDVPLDLLDQKGSDLAR